MSDTHKILLIHFYSNGDCLYATTIARQIKHDFPDCNLTWAIASNCKNIIANNPYVDHTIVVDYIPVNDPAEFKELEKQVSLKEFHQVFITHPSYLSNIALYDGCIRSNVYRAFPRKITVPVTPVLQLTEEEISNVNNFAAKHSLKDYTEVILFEFAPQSGQLNITKEIAISIAESIVTKKNAAIILSSANKIVNSNKAIIDGSALTLRETAALTHHCTLLLGCSSGITWITTSSAAKFLPMVQILNPNATWVNPISRDFKRFNLPLEKVIEMYDFDQNKISDCVENALTDFAIAKSKYNQQVPLHFKTTAKIVYELLCRFKFGQIIKHIRVNREVYGDNLLFYKEVVRGIVTAPAILTQNIFRKHLFNQ